MYQFKQYDSRPNRYYQLLFEWDLRLTVEKCCLSSQYSPSLYAQFNLLSYRTPLVEIILRNWK